MKISKKAITVLSFTIGACVFVSTALADMALGSGYDRLKDSVKYTASQMEKGLDNYTIEGLVTVKDNDQTILQASVVNKIDTEKQSSENTTNVQDPGGQTSNTYSYSDQKVSIYKNGTDEKYYVTEFPADLERGNRFDNPFNEKGAPEVEKIVDAVVGNLKDYVQVEEQAEGGRVYTGSLSEAQVPAVVNAVASFGIKQMISDEQRRMEKRAELPEFESDVFVKKALGTAVENKAGLIENVTGDVILSGKDKDGVQHDLSLNVVFKLSDIGSTKPAMPDLTGKNVETTTAQIGGFSSKYVGTYKNNIIMEKNGQFIKAGERILEITSVEKDKVTGKYHEDVLPEFKAEYGDGYNFDFEYTPNNSAPMSLFTYKNAKGEEEKGQLNPGGNGKIYLQLNIEVIDENSYRSNAGEHFDGEFNRVFEH